MNESKDKEIENIGVILKALLPHNQAERARMLFFINAWSIDPKTIPRPAIPTPKPKPAGEMKI